MRERERGGIKADAKKVKGEKQRLKKGKAKGKRMQENPVMHGPSPPFCHLIFAAAMKTGERDEKGPAKRAIWTSRGHETRTEKRLGWENSLVERTEV